MGIQVQTIQSDTHAKLKEKRLNSAYKFRGDLYKPGTEDSVISATKAYNAAVKEHSASGGPEPIGWHQGQFKGKWNEQSDMHGEGNHIYHHPLLYEAWKKSTEHPDFVFAYGSANIPAKIDTERLLSNELSPQFVQEMKKRGFMLVPGFGYGRTGSLLGLTYMATNALDGNPKVATARRSPIWAGYKAQEKFLQVPAFEYRTLTPTGQSDFTHQQGLYEALISQKYDSVVTTINDPYTNPTGERLSIDEIRQAGQNAQRLVAAGISSSTILDPAYAEFHYGEPIDPYSSYLTYIDAITDPEGIYSSLGLASTFSKKWHAFGERLSIGVHATRNKEIAQLYRETLPGILRATGSNMPGPSLQFFNYIYDESHGDNISMQEENSDNKQA